MSDIDFPFRAATELGHLSSRTALQPTFKMSKEFTYAEIQAHSAKKDLYVVIHDKVYNATAFVDEHP